MTVDRPTRQPEADEGGILLVDFIARDKGHLLYDDQCMATALAPLARRFRVMSSRESLLRMREGSDWDTLPFPSFLGAIPSARLQYLLMMFFIPCRGFSHIVFQAYDEFAVILFALLHPRIKIHLITTSNLTPARFDRWPRLAAYFIGTALRRAQSIFVAVPWERRFILERFPDIAPDRIHTKGSHIMAAPRASRPFQDRRPMILYVGPTSPYKPLQPMVDLIEADAACKYHYHFCCMDTGTETGAILARVSGRGNVTIQYGYLADEDYYGTIASAHWVILPHDRSFEGRSSGVFCDAVATGTPILSRDIAPQSDYFSQFGPMGLLVDFERAGWTSEVLGFDLRSAYPEFASAMERVREDGSIESIRRSFAHAISGAPAGRASVSP